MYKLVVFVVLWDRYMAVNVYNGSTCGFVGQVGSFESIYWECVSFIGRGRAL